MWFDDVKVTHTQIMVTQASDYGVWGDVLRELKAPEFTYRHGYQGQFSEKDKETGWNHFELREYDPVIGRWTSKDPAKQYWSPYVGMGNDPTGGVDPDGAFKTKFFASIYSLFRDGEVVYNGEEYHVNWTHSDGDMRTAFDWGISKSAGSIFIGLKQPV